IKEKEELEQDKSSTPQDIAELEQEIRGAAKKLDEAWCAQQQSLGNDITQELHRLVHLAVLTHWAEEQGGPFEKYNPAAHKEAIEKYLTTWGFTQADLDDFRTNINMALASSMTSDTIKIWKKDILMPDDRNYRHVRGERSISQKVRDYFHQSDRPLTSGERAALLKQLNEMQDGSKWYVKKGEKITLDSTNLYFEPSGLASFRALLARNHFGSVKIDKLGKQYFIRLTDGATTSL